MTTYRFPIKIEGVIELDDDMKTVRYIAGDEWQYGAWPRISPYGEDKDIVAIVRDSGITIEADIEIVTRLREIAEFYMDEGLVSISDKDLFGELSE